MKNNWPAQMKRRQQTQQPKPRDQRPKGGLLGLPLWVWLVFIVTVAGGGTLAVFQFFIWNKVPPELVGQWDVEGGPLAGGTFDFSRNGNLEMRFKKQGKEISLKGRVSVADKTLLTTTQNLQTGHEETTTSTIRELTARTLIFELDSGDVLKMGRWK
jgi:uncharacterized protein (TIGR03066 family)